MVHVAAKRASRLHIEAVSNWRCGRNCRSEAAGTGHNDIAVSAIRSAHAKTAAADGSDRRVRTIEAAAAALAAHAHAHLSPFPWSPAPVGLRAPHFIGAAVFVPIVWRDLILGEPHDFVALVPARLARAIDPLFDGMDATAKEFGQPLLADIVLGKPVMEQHSPLEIVPFVLACNPIWVIVTLMKLRPATSLDAELLFRWRNDPEVIANSFSSKGVNWLEHRRWLTSRLHSARPVYIFEDTQGIPVGTANVDGDTLSYTVAPEHRGRGLATIMLRYVKTRHGVLTCQIKPDNKKSISAATSAGHRVVLRDT